MGPRLRELAQTAAISTCVNPVLIGAPEAMHSPESSWEEEEESSLLLGRVTVILKGGGCWMVTCARSPGGHEISNSFRELQFERALNQGRLLVSLDECIFARTTLVTGFPLTMAIKREEN